MPGKFVASPHHPVNSPPIRSSSSQSQTPAQASKDSKARDTGEQTQQEPSLESMDPVAVQKQKGESSSASEHSGMRSALEKAKRKLSPSRKDRDLLPESEEEYEKLRQKEIEEQKKTEYYEQHKLGSKVHFGQGGMRMNG